MALEYSPKHLARGSQKKSIRLLKCDDVVTVVVIAVVVFFHFSFFFPFFCQLILKQASNMDSFSTMSLQRSWQSNH